MNDFSAKLHPEIVKSGLLKASLFLTGFELLQTELVDRVQSFYAVDFDENLVALESEWYRREVLSLAPPKAHPNTKKFHASCTWWVINGTLVKADIAAIQQIKKHRNVIAHELPKLMLDPNVSVDWQLFERVTHYVKVLGRFWGRVAVDTNSDFDGQSIRDEDIESSAMILLRYMREIVEEQAVQ